MKCTCGRRLGVYKTQPITVGEDQFVRRERSCSAGHRRETLEIESSLLTLLKLTLPGGNGEPK